VLPVTRTNPPPALAGPLTEVAPGPVPVVPPQTSGRAIGASNSIFTASVFEAQVALDRMAISCGSIDGVAGAQTRTALRAFQSREGLPATGELDAATRARLTPAGPLLATGAVAATDLDRLMTVPATWLGKSAGSRLDFEGALELFAERSHAHPGLLRRFNSTIDWSALQPGRDVVMPSVEREPPKTRAAFLQIRLGEKSLQAFDAANRLLAHFPCSIAQRVEKRPLGELRVMVVAPNPNYTFDPDVFPESAEARAIGRKLIIPPGPNNPVGTAWIGLDRPGYGIHGTPRPEDVGRTESHGCFRLANWNAEYLLKLVTVGTVVKVGP
jgi:lipoprotein-anchoring transpeptidase ErfK/SrfK